MLFKKKKTTPQSIGGPTPMANLRGAGAILLSSGSPQVWSFAYEAQTGQPCSRQKARADSPPRVSGSNARRSVAAPGLQKGPLGKSWRTTSNQRLVSSSITLELPVGGEGQRRKDKGRPAPPNSAGRSEDGRGGEEPAQ